MARIAKKWKSDDFGISHNFLCELIEKNNNSNKLSWDMYIKIRDCMQKQAHCHKVLSRTDVIVTMVRDVAFLGKLLFTHPDGLTSKEINILMNKGTKRVDRQRQLRATEKMLKNMKEVWKDVNAYSLGYTMQSRLKPAPHVPCTITLAEIPY